MAKGRFGVPRPFVEESEIKYLVDGEGFGELNRNVVEQNVRLKLRDRMFRGEIKTKFVSGGKKTMESEVDFRLGEGGGDDDGFLVITSLKNMAISELDTIREVVKSTIREQGGRVKRKSVTTLG